MKICIKKSIIFLLILVLVMSFLPMSVGASESTFYATSYSIKNTNGTAISNISKGSMVNISIMLKDTSVESDNFALDSYDFSRLIDSFLVEVLVCLRILLVIILWC